MTALHSVAVLCPSTPLRPDIRLAERNIQSTPLPGQVRSVGCIQRGVPASRHPLLWLSASSSGRERFMRMSGGHSKASRAVSASDPSRPLERTGSAFAAPEPSASPTSHPKQLALRLRRFGEAPNHRHCPRNPHRAGASPSRRGERNCPYSSETAPSKP